MSEIAEATGLDPGHPAKVVLTRDNRCVYVILYISQGKKPIVCVVGLSVCPRTLFDVSPSTDPVEITSENYW